MSLFSVIVPESTTNLFLDPVAGAADPDTSWDIAGDGSGSPDVTRSTTDALFEDGCFLFALSTSAYTRLYQATTVTATSYTISGYVKRSGGGAVTSSQVQFRFDSADVNPTTITAIRDGWYYVSYTGTATAGSRQFGLKALENNLKADGLQLENKAYATTLAYGDIEGFRSDGYAWTGTANASTSTRHSQERSGGRVRDMQTDLLAQSIRTITGGGAFDDAIITSQTAIEPGAIFQNNKIQPRQIDLGLVFYGSTIATLHSNRNTFYNAIKARLVTPIQPFIFRYTGNTEPMEISARYDGGLAMTRLNKLVEQTGLRLYCENPFWRSIGNDAGQLDVQDTVTTNYIAQRSVDGEWSNLATTLDNVVRALAKNNAGTLYIGGDMTAPGNYTVSWNGTSLAALSTGPGAATSALVGDGANIWAGTSTPALTKWNGSTWAAAGTAPAGTPRALLNDGNGNIYIVGDGKRLEYWNGSAMTKIAGVTANGTIYAVYVDGTDIYFGGAFTSIGGVSAARIAKLDTTTNTFSALGSGISSGTVYALTGDSTYLYVGGSFTNQGDANGDNIVRITKSGATMSSMGTGCNAQVNALVMMSSTLWAGCSAGVFGGVSGANGIAYWNGSWNAITGAGTVAGSIYALAVSGSTLYVGGTFDDLSSVSGADNFAQINGTTVTTVGSAWNGTTATIYAITINGSDIYIGGNFTNIGDANGDYLVKWNGSAYSSLGAGPGGIVRALAYVGSYLYLGGDFTNLTDANGDYISRFNGSAYSSISTGLSSNVYAITSFSSAPLICGAFTNAPGDKITTCNVATNKFLGLYYGDFSSTTTTGILYAVVQDTSGNTYVAGADGIVLKVTSANVVTVLGATAFSSTIYAMAVNPLNNNIWIAGGSGLLAYWNGARWTTLTTSTTAAIYALTFDDDGRLYIGGAFTSIGGVSAEAIASFYPANSAGVFSQIDIDLPSTPTVYAILEDNGQLTVGFSTAGSSITPGTTTITNNGTAQAFPIVKVTGPGTLRELTNVTTEKTIQFSNLTLGSGETVTLDLRLFKKTLKSNVRGAINSKINQSDLSEWYLQPGANTVNLLVTNSSATASMTWELLHESVDGGI